MNELTMGEFDVIGHYFNRQQTNRQDVKTAIGDDCAYLAVAADQWVAISTDTLVSGTHFLADIDPANLGYKALAVNLSDLAAAGASPAWLSLAITLPDLNHHWLRLFSDSLFQLLQQYQMQLIGGDTTKGPLSLTLTVQGLVPKGQGLTRAGAKKGDLLYVTGTLGDSAAGLALLLEQLSVNDVSARQFLLQRHLRPTARVAQGIALRGIASSAIDLSDGLSSDLRHILTASQCGAHIYLDHLPLSDALRAQCDLPQAYRFALAGGEDYELCFTVAKEDRALLEARFNGFSVDLTCIGEITEQVGVLTFFDQNQPITLDLQGYDHFKPIKTTEIPNA